MKYMFLLVFSLLSNLFAAGDNFYVVPDLGLIYVIPFVGILLSIAILPLVAHHFWEKNYGKIALMWAIIFY